MPTVLGTSTATWQRVVGFGNLTVPQLEIIIPSQRLSKPTRVGYGFVLVRDNAAPNNQRIIHEGPIHLPGRFITFTNLYGFTSYQYAWDIRWNVPNLAWVATF